MATAKKERGLKRFRLRQGVGRHYEPNPHYNRDEPEGEDNLRDLVFEAGEVVESKRDLVSIFPNKFEAYDDMTVGARNIHRGREQVEEDNENAKKKNMELAEAAEAEGEEDPLMAEETAQSMNYRGAHRKSALTPRPPEEEVRFPAQKSGGDEKPYVGPTEDDEDEDEDDDATSKKAKSSDDEEEDAEEEEEESDVTSDFEKAKDGDLRVVKRGRSYYVYEKGEDDPMSGSKKGLKTKSDVNKFIKKQVK